MPDADRSSAFQTASGLEIGDPIVHLHHGVGRFDGFTSIETGGGTAECLTLRYADEARVHVPPTALSLIGPWSGSDNAGDAPLDTLGGRRWTKARAQAAEQARDVAARLLRTRAARALHERTPYPIDKTAFTDFCRAFEHQPTPDQRQAMREVAGDLAAPVPMDRVLCGDVGFGKTEVAMRAAFIVADAGKQVAVLVPTTLLVTQHLASFQARFDGTGIAIGALSSLDGQVEAATLAALAEGSLDIVIGTHRLLGDDVHFPELGLVVIDEEHRFGVQQKQRVTAMRESIDVLTMTATPIPRTLAMSLQGLRAVSTIASPPDARQPVRTRVMEHDEQVLTDACRDEIARGGQTFVLHNRIDTIEQRVRMLAAALPEARVRGAHGELDETHLEATMRAFVDHEFDVLVATTIIETGIDVPNANTIVVEGAERFGLAQLHQLRGRVGRSDRAGVALMLTSDPDSLSDAAGARLRALESHQSLGSGGDIAARDLEIRGAGELLGTEQSGGLAELGQALFARLLKRTVAALESGVEFDPAADAAAGVDVDLGNEATLPAEWIADPGARMALYLALAEAESAQAIGVLQREAVERHGDAPAAAIALFDALALQRRCEPLGVAAIRRDPLRGEAVTEAGR